MSTTVGIRFSAEEKKLLDDAVKLDEQPGERGGTSAWLRRLALREAKRIVDVKAGILPAEQK